MNEERLDEIEQAIKDLREEIQRLKWDMRPREPEMPWSPVDPWAGAHQCRKCGIDLRQASHYVCVQPGCPTGLSGPTCFSGEAGL